ncbi:MAG TPA: hypothetical protein VF668_13385, partial [Pyrinomonadaceae bacterium]
MKHRSVIAFVIVAAALFAAPRLSHDLQSLSGALGARLRGELMHAFLSLPAGGGSPAAVAAAPRPAETTLASCPSRKPAERTRKSAPAAPPSRAEARQTEEAGDELAMIEEPSHGPGPRKAMGAEGPAVAAAWLPRGGEIAMIIPPDSGIEPKGMAHVSVAAARRLADEMRVSYVARGFDGKGAEWLRQGAALRRLEESLPGGHQLRPER